ncbi:hypothetical protein GCM10010273_64100 [Streptomyces lavendulocolor]|jgi:hypothetical protein
MAPRAGKWQRVPLIPQSRQAAETDPVPVYSSLMREWKALGRSVPGVPDHEWDVLVTRPVWPSH